MTETAVLLLFAHALADFVLQPGWMAEGKKTRLPVLLLHAGIVLVVSHAALGLVWSDWILLLAAAHLAIDAVKILAKADGPGGFLADQLAHLASVAAIAWFAPDLARMGYLPDEPVIAHVALILTGAILTVRAGSFAVGLVMQNFELPASNDPSDQGLSLGGETIGQLERGLILLLMLAGTPQGIGFLIAAKSILRFGTVKESRAISEYVIIGTLASFGWAIAISLGLLELRAALPPIAGGAASP